MHFGSQLLKEPTLAFTSPTLAEMLINKPKMKHNRQLQQTGAALPAGGKGSSHQANIPAQRMGYPQRFGTAPPTIRLDQNKSCTLHFPLCENEFIRLL